MYQRLALYWHTLRHLRPVQFYSRLLHRFRSVRPDLSPAPHIRRPDGKWVQPAQRVLRMHGPVTFEFLNVRRDLADSSDWNNAGWDKLWLYNLHYFDDLNASDAPLRAEWHAALLNRWIHENPPGSGNGWEPYPSSMRILNWIKFALAGNALSENVLHSLAIQCRYLEKNLEYHLLGNHLFVNAKALVFAGLFFQGQQAKNWFDIGLAIVEQELPEQVLPDGANFELSPMYHALFLEDILDLINLAQVFPEFVNAEIIDTWKTRAAVMLNWLMAMTHPDGEIALFNDSAFKIAQKPERLYEYAKRLSINLKDPRDISSINHLPESGYIRVNKNNLALIVDVAKVGPDYLPGHAHADTLSFELSLYGSRLFVNGGTSEYGTGEIRQYERSTAAHNTVVVDNQNSSEVWSGFRVARRAYPFGLKINKTEDVVRIECSHNGYERFNKDLVHTRTWKISNGHLYIYDYVEGSYAAAFAYYHLSPDVKILSVEASEIILLMKNGKRVFLNYLGSSLEVIDGFYAPEFGKRIPNQCLKLCLDKLDGASLQVSWDS